MISPTGLFPPPYTTAEKAHGRIEVRRIRVAPAPRNCPFPYAKQVALVERARLVKSKIQRETVYLITSLSPKKASPERLLTLNRGHWEVENRVHYVRDVSLNEDRRYLRKNPAMFAALRNLVISICRLAGDAGIPTFQRYFAAHLNDTLRIVGAAA